MFAASTKRGVTRSTVAIIARGLIITIARRPERRNDRFGNSRISLRRRHGASCAAVNTWIVRFVPADNLFGADLPTLRSRVCFRCSAPTVRYGIAKPGVVTRSARWDHAACQRHAVGEVVHARDFYNVPHFLLGQTEALESREVFRVAV